jgi:hypothetical protein
MRTKFQLESLKGRDHPEDQGISRRIILKLILGNNWNFIHPQHTFLFPSFYIGCGNMFRCQSTIIRPYFIKCLPTTTEQNNQNQLKSPLLRSQFKDKITMLNIKIMIK